MIGPFVASSSRSMTATVKSSSSAYVRRSNVNSNNNPLDRSNAARVAGAPPPPSCSLVSPDKPRCNDPLNPPCRHWPGTPRPTSPAQRHAHRTRDDSSRRHNRPRRRHDDVVARPALVGRHRIHRRRSAETDRCRSLSHLELTLHTESTSHNDTRCGDVCTALRHEHHRRRDHDCLHGHRNAAGRGGVIGPRAGPDRRGGRIRAPTFMGEITNTSSRSASV